MKRAVREAGGTTLLGAAGHARVAPRWLARALSVDGAAAAAIGVAALVLDLHRLAITSLYYDEAMSVGASGQPPGVLAQYLWGSEDQMPLYYALLSVWLHLVRVLGIAATEIVVRLPSVALAALAAVVVYLFGRRFWGRAAGLTAAALYVLNTLQLFHAQKARSYPLQLLLLGVAWYALFLVLSGADARRRVWVVYAAAMALAIYAQPFSALVLGAQVVAFAWYAAAPGPWRDATRAALRPSLISLGAVVALALPLGVDYALHGQPNGFVPAARPADIPAFFIMAQNGTPSLAYAIAAVAALGVVAAVLWRLPRVAAWLRGLQGGGGPGARAALALAQVPPGTAALASWLLVPLALSFAATQPYLNLHLFWWRYLVVVIPPLCLLAGAGIAAIRWPLAQGALALALLALAMPQTRGYYTVAQLSDFRTPAQWLNARYRAGDGIVCFSGKLCSVPLDYYLATYPGPARLTSSSPGAWLWVQQREVPFDPSRVAAFSARHARVFFVDATYGSHADLLAEGQQERSWLDGHARLVSACTAWTVTVRLYEAGPAAPAQASAPAPPC